LTHPVVSTCRYLGVVVDDELTSWTAHIETVLQELNRLVGTCYKLCYKLPGRVKMWGGAGLRGGSIEHCENAGRIYRPIGVYAGYHTNLRIYGSAYGVYGQAGL